MSEDAGHRISLIVIELAQRHRAFDPLSLWMEERNLRRGKWKSRSAHFTALGIPVAPDPVFDRLHRRPETRDRHIVKTEGAFESVEEGESYGSFIQRDAGIGPAQELCR